MEIDDLKLAWQTLDRRLERQDLLTRALYRDGKLEKMRSRLRPLMWGQTLQIIAGALIALWAAPFWVRHLDTPSLVIAGVILHLYGLGLIAFGAVMQVLMARIDYSAPVLEIQRQLARLRLFYVRGGLWIGLPWWFLWIPVLVLLVENAAGVDLYANAPSVILIGAAVGVAGLLATWGFWRWASGRPRFAERLERGAAGGSLNRARDFLADIERFADER